MSLETNTSAIPTLKDLLGQEEAERIIAARRHLHQHPEIGLDTPETAAFIERELRRLGITEIRRFHQNGIAALVEGEKNGPTIGLRADMDALPMAEDNELPYKSLTPNRAHLCGHDGHTAGLLATAAYLMKHRSFAGKVLLIFQPGEEGYAGADKMMKDGLFDVYPCREVYAIHGEPGLPVGQIKLRRGAQTASVDLIHFTVEGKGGHGARPHLAVDPIPAAAQLILSLQTIVARNVDPNESAVYSICWLQAGDEFAPSVIAPRVKFSATVRTFSPTVRDLIEDRTKAICEGLGIQTGTNVILDYVRLYPAVINDTALFDEVLPILETTFGKEALVTDFEPAMIGEDFAFMTEALPGLYLQLGLDDKTHCAPLHNPHFEFNEAVLGFWVKTLATIVEKRLS